VPYGWQKTGQTCEIISPYSKRLNVLGFMSLSNDSLFYTFENTVTAEVVVATFDAFSAQYEARFKQDKIPCVVVLDNASVHRNQAVQQGLSRWLDQGVILHFLPPYSPELNPIEILWRKIKYDWLPIGAYKNFSQLTDAVHNILRSFGDKYRITFG
jgi:hypothetical protein